MYAIIKLGGTQHKVEPGTVIETNRLSGDPGDVISLENSVLMLKDGQEIEVGRPVLEGIRVDLEINDHLRGEKLIAFKMKRRKRSRRKKGHRQELTRVTVKDIVTAEPA